MVLYESHLLFQKISRSTLSRRVHGFVFNSWIFPWKLCNLSQFTQTLRVCFPFYRIKMITCLYLIGCLQRFLHFMYNDRKSLLIQSCTCFLLNSFFLSRSIAMKYHFLKWLRMLLLEFYIKEWNRTSTYWMSRLLKWNTLVPRPNSKQSSLLPELTTVPNITQSKVNSFLIKPSILIRWGSRRAFIQEETDHFHRI